METKDKKTDLDKIRAKVHRLNLPTADERALTHVLAEPIGYVPDNRFRRPSFMAMVLDRTIDPLPGSSLNASEEETLFLQMNYASYRMAGLSKKLLKSRIFAQKTAVELIDWYRRQQQTHSKIVAGNMGLVLAMAKRVNYPGVEFCDLISEGSMALLRSTDKFDCGRGFKFSTYACRAILKSFSRVAKQSYRYRQRFPVQLEVDMVKDDSIQVLRQETHEEWTDEVSLVVNKNLADLSGIERSVVRLRFSLGNEQSKPLTLKQVGDKLGLTKERIRQIQNNALGKLRTTTQERMAIL